MKELFQGLRYRDGEGGKIRKYEKEAYMYLSVVSFNSKWQYILQVVSLHVFKYSRYVDPASRVSTCVAIHVHV